MALDLSIFEENKNIMFLEIIINKEGIFEEVSDHHVTSQFC